VGNKKIASMSVIRRLPKYHRYLRELLTSEGDIISSKKLSEGLGLQQLK